MGSGEPHEEWSDDRGVREVLAAEQAEVFARVDALSRSMEDIVSASVSANADDEHDPEGSTIAFERAQVAALLAQARAHLAESTEALQRLDAGGYGRCERCGAAIAPERLEARPTARTCIHCAARHDV
jgi:DnaK suppressor protein